MGAQIHLVVPGLFLPGEAVEQGCAGRQPRALETLLARADTQALPAESLEGWICDAFGAAAGAIAPVTLQADGVEAGTAYWLRADPVHLVLRGSDIILRPLASVGADEAAQLCEALNRHFAADGLQFLAPHPQRWYLRMEQAPRVETHPLAQAAGRDIRNYLPHGPDALAWHKVLNEIQMVLHGHPVNDLREERGEWAVNSIWPWGGGYGAGALRQPFEAVHTDSPLAAAFAAAAGIRQVPLAPEVPLAAAAEGTTLVVWDGLNHAAQHGDLEAWCGSLGALEACCVGPALGALRRRQVERVTLDALEEGGSWRFTLTAGTAWRFWRRRRRLSQYPGILG